MEGKGLVADGELVARAMTAAGREASAGGVVPHTVAGGAAAEAETTGIAGTMATDERGITGIAGAVRAASSAAADRRGVADTAGKEGAVRERAASDGASADGASQGLRGKRARPVRRRVIRRRVKGLCWIR